MEASLRPGNACSLTSGLQLVLDSWLGLGPKGNILYTVSWEYALLNTMCLTFS